MAGIELVRPVMGEFTRLIPGMRHALTDVTPEAIARAKDLISREDVLKRVVEQYRKIMPDEFIPVQGIARGEHNTLVDISGKPMLKTILGDDKAVDRTKQIHNLAQQTERQLGRNEYLNNPFYHNTDEGRIAVNNPYDEVDVGDMLDESTLGIDYTQVHPLHRAIYEMSQKALQHHGISPEDEIRLFRKQYPGARKGSIKEPVLSYTTEPSVVGNQYFNLANDAWDSPLYTGTTKAKNVLTSDLITPENFSEREMQIAKQALDDLKVIPKEELSWKGGLLTPMDTLDTAQFAYPKLLNDVMANPTLNFLQLYRQFERENGRIPNEQEVNMMKVILDKLGKKY